MIAPFRGVSRVVLAAVVALTVAAAAEAQVETKPLGSLDRLAGGLDAKAAVTDQDGFESSTFLPGAWLSYNLTSRFAAAALIDQHVKGHYPLGMAGLRFFLARFGEGELAAGVNATYYGDADRWSWSASMHGNWPLVFKDSGAVALFGIVSASYDPGEDGPDGEGRYERKELRAGLRWQAFGGQ